jgi:hypothetical protein
MLDLLGRTTLAPVKISLTLEQMIRAVGVGVEKTARSYRDGWSHRYGYRDEMGRLKTNIDGCCAELAAGLALGVPWHGDPFNTGPDLGARVQVRHTERHDGRLIVHEKTDADDEIFVLVTGEGPGFLVWGWVWGREAKQLAFWCDPTRTNRWAYFVPRTCPPMRRLCELEGLDL